MKPSLQSVATARTQQIAANQSAPQKLALAHTHFMRNRINIGSPGLSYHLKWLGARERIRCAPRAPPIFYLALARSCQVLPCSADWYETKTDNVLKKLAEDHTKHET